MDRELGENGCPGGILSGVGGDLHSEDAGVPDGFETAVVLVEEEGGSPHPCCPPSSSDSSTRTSFHKTIFPSSSGSTGF